MWAWALTVAGAVTFYEVYFNNESQHPGSKFWTDRVPGYFTLTLAYTAVVLVLGRFAAALTSHLNGWMGLLIISVAVCILFAVAVPGGGTTDTWWIRFYFGRNVMILTTLYLVPPYVVASLIHWRVRTAD
jgi:hypothetical protein